MVICVAVSCKKNDKDESGDQNKPFTFLGIKWKMKQLLDSRCNCVDANNNYINLVPKDPETLTFNEDGTGEAVNLTGKIGEFKYIVEEQQSSIYGPTLHIKDYHPYKNGNKQAAQPDSAWVINSWGPGFSFAMFYRDSNELISKSYQNNAID